MVRFQEEDYDSDEDDVSLPQVKNTSPIMPDVYEATGEADTYINIYSNSGKISTHNKKAKQTYNERNQAGKVFVKVFIAILIAAIIFAAFPDIWIWSNWGSFILNSSIERKN